MRDAAVQHELDIDVTFALRRVALAQAHDRSAGSNDIVLGEAPPRMQPVERVAKGFLRFEQEGPTDRRRRLRETLEKTHKDQAKTTLVSSYLPVYV